MTDPPAPLDPRLFDYALNVVSLHVHKRLLALRNPKELKRTQIHSVLGHFLLRTTSPNLAFDLTFCAVYPTS